MKVSKIAGLLGAASIFGIATSAGAVTGPTISSQSFNSTLMVDTHLGYTDGTYGLIRNASGQYVPADKYVSSAANYLGIYYFRDGLTDGSNGSSPLSYYETLAKNGINYLLIASGDTQADLMTSIRNIDTLNQTAGAPGHVVAIEGANEINNSGGCWGPAPCQTGLPGALSRQATLLKLVHGDTAVPHIGRVIHFTGWGDVAGAPGPEPLPNYADYDNQHPYPAFGTPPYFWLSRPQALNNTSNPYERAVYTETGYPVGPLYGSNCNSNKGGVCWNNNNVSQTKPEVDEAVQAKQTLDMPFDAALLGISKLGLYELLSAYPEQGSKDGGFGLFHYKVDGTLSPRPVATAIHNLMTITADAGTVSTVWPLYYQVTGLPTQGYCPGVDPKYCTFTPTLAIENSKSEYFIAVWAEQKIWDADSHTDVAATPHTATITLGHTYNKVDVFDPYTSAAPIASYSNTSQINVSVVDRPLLVHLSAN